MQAEQLWWRREKFQGSQVQEVQIVHEFKKFTSSGSLQIWELLSPQTSGTTHR